MRREKEFEKIQQATIPYPRVLSSQVNLRRGLSRLAKSALQKMNWVSMQVSAIILPLFISFK